MNNQGYTPGRRHVVVKLKAWGLKSMIFRVYNTCSLLYSTTELRIYDVTI